MISWAWVLACSGAIAVVAFRLKSLSRSGAFAAFVVGVISLGAGWGWGALIIAWFVLGSLISKLGKQKKSVRTASIVAKGGERDAWQVVANGGVFTVAAGLKMFDTFGASHEPWIAMMAVGALCAAAADTWATEIGTLSSALPWSLRTWSRVAHGTSGAVSLVGTAAMIAGAAITALLAVSLGVVPRDFRLFAIGSIAGIAGALVDTVLGAFVQEQRYCARCNENTERAVHTCGNATELRRGVARFDNDVVNAACTVVGGAVAVALFVFPIFHT